MSSLAAIRSANLNLGSSLSYQPVAVFVGGTSGIGEGMARAFAHHRNGDAHIVLVGRNRAAAEAILASLPKPEGKQVTHEFVECDLTLMRNVRHTTAELVQRLPKVNFLVMSPGIMTLQGRTETEEGIDRKLAVHYYGRWRFAYDLIPLLQKAKDAGEDAKVMSVLSAGVDGGEIDLNDLGLKKNYSLPAAARHASVYNDLMIQSFAQRYPNLSFMHSAPGIVSTSLFKGIAQESRLMSLASPLVNLLARTAGVSPIDCGEYMWRGVYAGGAGWSRWSRHGEDIGSKGMWSTQEAQEKLWEHTVEATS